MSSCEQDGAPGPKPGAAPTKSSLAALRAACFTPLALGSGVLATRRFSDAVDQLVEMLWTRAGQAPRSALVATGGWGRRQLCPYSDLDFVLVTHEDPATVSEFVESILYPLWDAGLSVGHAVRSPNDAAALAAADLPTATALLDARHVLGDRAIYQELVHSSRRAIAPHGNPNRFIAMLSEEMERRHERFGASLYLLEPNLKQGIGALRDLDTATWAARARYAIADIFDMVKQGHLSVRRASVLEAARDFLLLLRSLAQMSAGRRIDPLTFEVQEEIAPLLYADSKPSEGVAQAVAPAVEALMRAYYLHGRSALRVTERLLGSVRVAARRPPRINRIDQTFLTFNGQLAARRADVFRAHPAETLRAFRLSVEHDLPIYGHTFELMEESIASHRAVLRDSEEACSHFVEALVDIRDSKKPSALENLHHAGALSAIIPEFAACTGRVQHDLYHVYTVDQHQLYAVAMLKQTLRGDHAESAPLAHAVAKEIGAAPDLLLGTLLHDVGKPMGKGHSEKGAVVAGQVARRLGFTAGQVSDTEFLVRQHLTMSHVSQRRDLADPDVIRRFCDRMGTLERLGKLFLLTRVDAAMTAPGNLSAWKDQLLGELYQRARAVLSGDSIATGDSLVARTRARAVSTMQSQSPETFGEGAEAHLWLEGFIASLDDSFVQQLSPRQLVRQTKLAFKRAQEGSEVAIGVTHFPLKAHSEVAVVASDTAGLLANITGALSAHRVDVLGAAIGTALPGQLGSSPLAVDLFFVHDLVGKAIAAGDPRWERLLADLRALEKDPDSSRSARELISKRRQERLKKRVTPAVEASAKVVNDVSSEFSVLEVFAKDRPGLLFAITQTLCDEGVDVYLSKISTEGEKVADVFYVRDSVEGGKLSAERIAQVQAALRSVIDREVQ